MDEPRRKFPAMESPPGAQCVFDGRVYSYFGGTSYLGLHGHPDVIAAACEATQRYGIHTATSRALFGNSPVTLAVERLAAEFFDRDDAFYFVSGYVANFILIRALAPRFDVVFLDDSAHYSLVDAARATGQPAIAFRSRDATDLEHALQRHLGPGQRPLVLTDGVSPSFGWVAPIGDYCRVLARYDGAAILVDDAHGIGTLGGHGRGTLEHLGLYSSAVNAGQAASDCESVRLYMCGTLSKALGGFGGVVPGSRTFVEQARSATHFYEGASAPPVPAAAASARALELVKHDPDLRRRLAVNVRAVRDGLRRLGLPVEDLPTPIISLRIGSTEQMRCLHETLKDRGLIVPYVSAYSGVGPEGSLRIAVFATHTAEMIQQLLDELHRVL